MERYPLRAVLGTDHDFPGGNRGLSPTAGWRARLELEFERRGARTVLAARRHDGPLVVQKSLHPEGEQICHAIVVHPPAGIAGGDHLSLDVTLGGDANVVLATPGAAKWYRSAGSVALQEIRLHVGPGAWLEWLPQETIVYDGALAQMRTSVNLADDARYLGWEILCFGRSGSGERITRGHCTLATRVERAGKPLFVECGELDGAGEGFASPVLLGGHSVCGTLLAIAPECDTALRDRCRELSPESGAAAITLLPGLLVARYLGDSSESAKHYFIELRRLLRPAIMAGVAATDLRIWST